jgi:pimeloyl-ACP methyl ester carboxylesterase
MTDSSPTVVFLHGLARTGRSLRGLRDCVNKAGFKTCAISYPSRTMSIPDLASHVAVRIREATSDGPLLGITHSLGGILVRHMATSLNWKGLVMLAPPNNGSSVAARMRNNPLFKGFYGPAGGEVAVSTGWPAPPSPFVVIAGTQNFALTNPTSWMTRSFGMFPGGVPNDGTLSVTETKHPEMQGFRTVEASHTWIMNHPETKRLILNFLRDGTLG